MPSWWMLRVYDTRLVEEWLQAVATELVGVDVDNYIIAGNFLTQPHLKDGPAFHSSPIRRWGPAGQEPYYIAVPPRPLLASWLQRCHHQLAVEVPRCPLQCLLHLSREACPADLTAIAIRHLVPQVEALLHGPHSGAVCLSFG